MIDCFANLDEQALAEQHPAHRWWWSGDDRHFDHCSDCREPSWMFSKEKHALCLAATPWRFEFLVCLSCSRSLAAFVSNCHPRSRSLSGLLPCCLSAAAPSWKETPHCFIINSDCCQQGQSDSNGHSWAGQSHHVCRLFGNLFEFVIITCNLTCLAEGANLWQVSSCWVWAGTSFASETTLPGAILASSWVLNYWLGFIITAHYLLSVHVQSLPFQWIQLSGCCCSLPLIFTSI